MANDTAAAVLLSSAATQPLPLELGWPSYQQSTVDRWQGVLHERKLDYIAEEVPISLVYNGLPHVVMLATPNDLEEFALGFSITEGIIKAPQELLSARIYNRSNGIEVQLKIPDHRFQCLADKGRNLTGRTGCGLCGASTLRQAIRQPNPVKGDLTLSAAELCFCFNGHQTAPETKSINRSRSCRCLGRAWTRHFEYQGRCRTA